MNFTESYLNDFILNAFNAQFQEKIMLSTLQN